MVYQGTVQNGMVVFNTGVPLPDGTQVNIEAVKKPLPQNVDDTEIDPIFRMGERAVDLGIADLSVNIDHYLYGHPKVTDGQ